MKTKNVCINLVLFFTLLSVATSLPADAAIDFQGENEYCILPPFVETAATPNLLLMFDNSASMYDLGYVAGTYGAPPTFNCGGTVGNVSETFCLDDTYQNSKVCSENMATTCAATSPGCTCIDQYMGYFDQTKYYQYVEAPADNLGAPGANDYFQEVAGLPAICTFGNKAGEPNYVCVNFTGTGTDADPYRVSGFWAKGKFLNWLTASKLDIQKQILTGGKYDGTYAVSESRGCNGRRFTKLLKNPSTGAYYPITFATRGPNAGEPDFVNPATQGGFSRFEIFKGVNASIGSCVCAVANWTSGNYGQASVESNNCMNLATSGATGNELATFNHSLQTCWLIKDNIAKGQPLFGPPNTTDLTGACLSAYRDKCYGTGPKKLDKRGNDYFCTLGTADLADDIKVYDGVLGTVPAGAAALTALITNEASGNWACTGYVDNAPPPVVPPSHPLVPPPYDTFGNNQTGFLGQCVTGFLDPGGPQALNFDWTPAAIQDCVKREMLHYCYGQSVAEVTDPSEGAADTSSTGNIPAVIMEAGTRSLGTPAGTLFAKVSTTPPTGVIHEFSNRIRFGVSKFNQVGTLSECNQANTNIKCPTVGVNRDGSYLDPNTEVGDPVGGHTTGGIIQAVDSVVAETWTPFAEAMYEAIGYFAQRNDLRLDPNDFPIGTDPVLTPCQSNNILLISDGLPTADVMRAPVNTLVSYAQSNLPYDTASGPAQTDFIVNNVCMKFAGSRNVDDLAYLAQIRNIKNFSQAPAVKSEKISTYTIFNGVSQSADITECNPMVLMEHTAERGGGVFKQAKNPAELSAAIRTMLETIAGRATSGTAASVIASGQGSGANLLQAIFYPKKDFPGFCSGDETLACTTSSTCVSAGAGTCMNEINWIGTLHNLWYYIDPRLGDSHIMIETTQPSGAFEKQLNYGADCSISFRFDPATSKTEIVPVAGSSCPATNVSLDQTQYFLWEAGRMLFGPSCGYVWNPVTLNWDWTCEAPVPGSPSIYRYIYTTLDGFNMSAIYSWWPNSLDTFTSNVTAQGLLRAADAADARSIINYAIGNSDGGFRNRRVNLVPAPGTPKPARWRFGDIVNSTPKVVSWVKLNNYDKSYNDFTYRDFTISPSYTDRGKTAGTYGRVYVGANDGMLHAFRLGTLNIISDSTNRKATLSGWQLGWEEWSYMPRSSMPYLKYLMDPNYTHLFYVDATPYAFDASICQHWSCPGNYWDLPKDVNSWRTVVIGGSRYGGASKNACTNDITSDGLLDKNDCVVTPGSCSITSSTFCTVDSECPPGESCVHVSEGRSSYFALDVTTGWPDLLWEFSHPDLGFTTTGPAVIRINGRKPTAADPAVSEADEAKNGRWLVVFASGPTGPIDTANHQFKGYSDQNLKLFIFDLKQGPGLNNVNVRVIDTGKQYAYAGSLNNGSMDYDLDYQDDALYIGYVQAETTPPTAATKWTKGGVLRLITREDLKGSDLSATGSTALNLNNWQLSELTVGGDHSGQIGAVTSSIGHIAHYNRGSSRPDKGWLYFGSGRYYFKTLFAVDDAATTRSIFGVEEPCLTSLLSSYALADNVCGAMGPVSLYDSTNSSITSLPAGKNGWFIDLSGTSATRYNERVITDPLASPSGAVFFTTFAPTTDACSFGGSSYIWATKFDTGGSVASSLKGKAILQVSTGEIKEIDLKDAFKAGPDNPDPKLERRSAAIDGVPPMDKGLNILVAPPPIETFMHIRKK